MLLQFFSHFSDPANMMKLISIACIFLVPFLLVYYISRGFERAQKTKPRFSYLFWPSLILTLIYIIWYAIWAGYRLWDLPFFGNEILCISSFFMYLFLLKLRERMMEEDAWDRFTRFFAPALFFYLVISALMIHLIYIDAVARRGVTELQQENPLDWLLNNFGYPFAFYFIFLSYIECKDLLKSLKVIHKPLVLSAFLVITTLFLWLYEQWCIFLFRGTPFYQDVMQLPDSFGPFGSWGTVEMLPGFAGSLIAIANMLFLYKKLKEPLPEVKEEETEQYAFALFQFLTKISEVVGGASITIFRSAVDGYNSRFNKNMKVEDTISLSNIEEKEWPEFMSFVLWVFYQCIGPVTWEKAEEVEKLKGIAETAKRSIHAWA